MIRGLWDIAFIWLYSLQIVKLSTWQNWIIRHGYKIKYSVIKNNMKYNYLQCHTPCFFGIKIKKEIVNKMIKINDKI